ncbi:MAG: metallophosphatase family protein [Verrucomicrobiae bacterium]|nr:metallophosphatase family protein [Verrucomicrobiae bacterium]
MKIGVISDTHGHMDPALERLFAGVNQIFHAGDVGGNSVLSALARIAPVIAVRGNMDNPGCGLKETEIVELGQHKFIIQHIVRPNALSEHLKQLIQQLQPCAVVFGHTHGEFCERIGDVLFLNPGYAGPPKPGYMRTVAILHCNGPSLRTEFFSLDPGMHIPPL